MHISDIACYYLRYCVRPSDSPGGRAAMGNLAEFAAKLSQECPTLDIRRSRGALIIRRGRTTARLRAKKEIAMFGARERSRRREEGINYLDLGTGSLFVDEPGLFLQVTLPRSMSVRLSPYQCALLSAVIGKGASEWFERGIAGPQVDLIRIIKLELGIAVPPMAMSRFLNALRRRGILRKDGKRSFQSKQAFDSLREDFRLSAVGRADTYAGDYRSVQERLAERLGKRFALGVAAVLGDKTGAWIEPRDYLVDRSALPLIQDALGSPVPRGYEGTAVVIRPALRVPLGLLTLGQQSIQALLAFSEATRMDSPVARQAGLGAWETAQRDCQQEWT